MAIPLHRHVICSWTGPKKLCLLCLTIKPLKAFDRVKRQCQKCRIRKIVDRNRINPTPHSQANKRWRKKYRDRLIQEDRDRYWSDPERFRKEKRDWWNSLSKDEQQGIRGLQRWRYWNIAGRRWRNILACRKWYNDHKTYSINQVIKWAKNHRERIRDTADRHRARKMNAPIIDIIDRLAVYERDGGKCHIYHRKVSIKTFTIDHLIALSRGGPHAMQWVAIAHLRCNSSMGAGRFPAQLRLY